MSKQRRVPLLRTAVRSDAKRIHDLIQRNQQAGHLLRVLCRAGQSFPELDERIVDLVAGQPRPLAPAAVEVLAREGYEVLGRAVDVVLEGPDGRGPLCAELLAAVPRHTVVLAARAVRAVLASPIPNEALPVVEALARHLAEWQELVDCIRAPRQPLEIAIVGKYTGLKDAYKSLSEALVHGGIANRVKPDLQWLDAEIFESEDPIHRLEGVDGILVPGGFGERGTEGKIAAAKLARERNIPYFGICLGMQMAVIEAARNLAGIEGAGSSEFNNYKVAVVGMMTEWQRGNQVERRERGGNLGGTMRLGEYPCDLLPGTKVRAIYGAERIQERHRHRYEININFRDQLEGAGLVFSGMSPDRTLPEIVEIPTHPWFVGVQFHPELKSKPFAPHPLFASFVEAAVKQSRLV